MSSILGLPEQYSDVTVLIRSVHLHPLCVLVEFWGKFSEDRTADYECLAKEIQSPGNASQEFEGKPGDQCLVQEDDTWYRSRIVSRNGSNYSVFLFDKGRTCSTTTSRLAWGKKNHFHLPPEVEFCVLANVLPLSPENRWSPVALEFLKSLSGKSLKAHVQDVLVPHRTFLLHIPCISKQMYEMGIARKLSPDVFQDYVLTSLQSHSGVEVSPGTQMSMGAGERLHKKDLFMYPELSAGTVETVIVTEVINPRRMFCQLKVFSQELKKLSGQITQCCEGRTTNCIISPEMVGFPCAARGSDGRWYRSVLQQVCSNKVVEVLNVDYGTKQFVQMENVRPLATEFFRMPVVTYICSLHGIIDKGLGWTTSQIGYLRTLLLHKTVIAKFEYQSISEGVQYVTLYGDESTSINNLFGSKESCFLESEKPLGDYAIRSTASSRKHPAQQERNQRKVLTSGQAVEEKEGKGIVVKLPVEDLSLNSSHVVVVQHISDPSEFWIQTQNYSNELDELMDSIYHLYKDSENKDVAPSFGLYCVAKAKDGEFYRATVAEVGETHVKVFFVDYGNTELVDRSNIRTLPDEFKKLPCLSLKCSLAGVRPKDGKWSQSACDYFIKAVTDKEVTVHVTAKFDEGYVVQLTDPKAQGERDLSTLMCSSGHAERAETRRQLNTKMSTQPAILPQLPDARLYGVYSNKGMFSQATLNTVGPAGNERQIPTFKEHMFPIGSVIDVSVSYIESPNDFWCQQVQNAGHLKLLMHDIQANYAGSEFQPNVEMACIARHPDNRMWYRALVIHKHETPDVDVLFVDYGQMETVSLYDLRRISPQFLALQGQAFRCSLLNPVDPTSAINEWNAEAIAKFHSFVETAASNFAILKCTIYAVMYSEQKIVFNIVDLETPFESVCTSMVNLVKSAPPKKAAGPSFRLDTYYYSMHNVKTGTEEQVTVTCVNNVHEFYCHLERNADVIKDLKIKVGNLCHQLENVKLPTVFGTLCFAKYTDGHWYRGQIKATKPAILVHFVDYGDTIEVEKSDLLPVPREANDIMSVPVQAVACSLSDVPANVPTEMNRWFETSVTECKFRALIVAREPDGKLQVELYHCNTQINSKIKKMFQTEKHSEQIIVHHSQRVLEASGNHAQNTPKVVPKQAAEIEDPTQTINGNSSAPKPACQMRNADMNLQSAPKPLCQVYENSRRIRAAPFEFYIPPHKRQSCRQTPSSTENGSELAGAHIKPGKNSLPTETKQLINTKSHGTESKKESDVERFPTLADLPLNSITSDMEADVYVSHCNSPMSFYVQLVRDEDEIFSLVEKLNDPQSTPQTKIVKDVQPGDLVQAEFAEDSSWYRAVVRETHGKTMALVEFVDFGNTAMMPIDKLGRLQKSFLQPPIYSTHCMLSEAAGLRNEEMLNQVMLSAFKKDIGGNGEKVLKCNFIRPAGSVWEVSLRDSGVNVTCKVPLTCSTDGSENTSEEPEQVKEQPAQIWQNVPDNSEESPPNSSLCYHQQEFLEGQRLEVYITAIDDAQTFWCQPADSGDLEKITSSVSKVLDAADHKHIDPGFLPPGSPCIALFSDDGFWYRAEVIDKDGNELSVLFVDYGNKTQVNFKDVREIPPDLMETPSQAFLCELEGFDASHGSWDSSAVDELSVLTTDKVLQLTVTRVTRGAGKIKCLVQMEYQGQVINEALETWWKSSTTENQPGAVGMTTSYQTPLQCDSTVKETALSQDQLEYAKGQGIDIADACICPQRDQSEEQSTGELVDLHADVLPCDGGIDETRLPHNKGDQGILTLSCDKSAVETEKGAEEEAFSVLDIIGPGDFNSPLDENQMNARDESEGKKTDLESLPGEVHTYSIESRFDNMNSSDPTEDRDDSKVIMARDNSLTSTTTVKMVSRETLWPKESIDLLETHDCISDNLKRIQTASLLPCCVLPAFEQEISMGEAPKEELPCVTPHVENVLMTGEETLAHHEDTYSALPADLDTAPIKTQTCTAPSQDSGDGFEEANFSVEEETCSVEEVTCSFEEATCSFEEVTCSFEEATCSVEEATCSFEEATCSVEEATCSVEEGSCLTDVSTDPNEQSNDWEVTSARGDRLSITLAEVQHESKHPGRELPQLTEAPSEHQIGDLSLQDEAMHNKENSVTKDETSALHKDHLFALPSDTEPQEYTVPCPNLRDQIEEVTCLVRENCRTDICRGPHQENASEEIEQPVHSPPVPERGPADEDNSSLSHNQ
ncbi:tudor domain-containing 6 isoform X2 [Anoplopoma fimbria]|uniref:tudor domain-containing 6 isoform X2 n=1 Tax=Anoplopoma fimbria TaxID=229290 RepID=UPI0023EC398A|nr:tudor domain-containing 6 isoform X2 [Anoplopoma fimbria]